MHTSHKYSLWLEPNQRSGIELQHCIEMASQVMGVEPFAPHMTLIGSATKEDFTECAGRFLMHGAPIVACTNKIVSRDTLYQRLVILIQESTCRKVVQDVLGIGRCTSWLQRGPHVSLLYADADVEAISFDWLEIPESITFDRLSLWSTQDHYSTWSRVRTVQIDQG